MRDFSKLSNFLNFQANFRLLAGKVSQSEEGAETTTRLIKSINTVRPPCFADFGRKILGHKNRETGGPRNREASHISIHDPNILL